VNKKGNHYAALTKLAV